jgi:membrane-bound lytic murein transglycosylase D
VAPGESPYVIANKYGVDLADFMRWNKLTRRSVLRVGQELIVQSAGEGGGVAEGGRKKITHTVRRGDNPSVIANKYNVELDDFLKWNDLSKRSVLHIGETYVVYQDE